MKRPPERAAVCNRMLIRQKIKAGILVSLLLLALLFLSGGCGNQFVFLPKPGEGDTPADFGIAYSRVLVPVKQGVNLVGWHLRGRANLPPILYLHGNNSNLSDCLPYIRLFHRLGFPVWAIDYRGHGKSSGRPVEESDYYEDAHAILNHMEKSGCNPEQIIYFGQSIGAAVALQMALEKPPAGLVLESPFTSISEMARHLAPVGYRLIGWSIGSRFDNLGKIGRLAVPLLMVQADGDPTVPLEMSLRLFGKAPEPKYLHIYHSNTHCDAPAKDGDGMAAALLAFSSEIRGAATRHLE